MFLVILGTYISYLLMTPYLICPVNVQNSGSFELSLFNVDVTCEPNSVFTLHELKVGCQTDCKISAETCTFFKIFGLPISAYPFLFHAFVISAVCSIIGPFGGFLASGFKRACKRKARLIQRSVYLDAYQIATKNLARYRTLAPSSPVTEE